MEVCKTKRLTLRHFKEDDADFIVTLLNDESFIKHIGDKKVRTRDDAMQYLKNGPLNSYNTLGFGLNLVVLKGSNTPIGICGLLKRDGLAEPDLGYALLPEYCSKGYAFEASSAVLKDVNENHNLTQVLAITSPENTHSNNLLKKLGFTHTGLIKLYEFEDNLYQYSFLN